MHRQQSLLPRIIPSVPGLDLAASSIYCDETGGDYYDYFNLGLEDEKRFAFAITVGDVSGHGISSALLMATARALLRQRASMSGQANHIITDVNRNLAIDTQETGQEILSAIIEAVHSFRGDNDPEDDITMIVVKAVEYQ